MQKKFSGTYKAKKDGKTYEYEGLYDAWDDKASYKAIVKRENGEVFTELDLHIRGLGGMDASLAVHMRVQDRIEQLVFAEMRDAGK